MKKLTFKRKVYRSSTSGKIRIYSILLFLSIMSFISCSNDEETAPQKSKEMSEDKTFNNKLYATLKSDTLFKATCKAFNIREKIYLKQKEGIDLETAKDLIKELREKYNWYYMYQYIAKYNLEEFEKLKKKKSNLKYTHPSVTVHPYENLAFEYTSIGETLTEILHDEFGSSIYADITSKNIMSPRSMLRGSCVLDFLTYFDGLNRHFEKVVLVCMFDRKTYKSDGNGYYYHELLYSFNIREFDDQMRIVIGLYDYIMHSLESYQREHSDNSNTDPSDPSDPSDPEDPNNTGNTGNTGGSAPLVDETDETFVNSNTECVYDKLSENENSIVNKLLKGFKDIHSKIDVTLKVKELSGRKGKTNFKFYTTNGEFKRGECELIIDQDVNDNKKPLEIARVFLHEAFHTYIYGKIYQEELHNGLCPEPNFTNDFNAYKEKYKAELEAKENNNSLNDQAQHNYMADFYISYIKKGLIEFAHRDESCARQIMELVNQNKDDDPENDVDINQLFECLAWGGLSKTDKFASTFEANKKQFGQSQIFLESLPKEKCE